MIAWSENEEVFLKKPYLVRQTFSLRTKLCLVSYTIAGLAAIEHLLAKTSHLYGFELQMKYCNWTIDNRLEYFSTHDFKMYFQVLPYHPVLGVFFFVSRPFVCV